MDDEKEYYVVFRIYTSKERPEVRERSRVYGWTSSKKVLKAFMEQRDDKKYAVRKVPQEQLASKLKIFDDETEILMIDFIKINSAQTGEEFHLFMNESEKDEVEKRVVRIFDELCSIDNIKGDIDTYVNMIVHLEEKYYDALFYLGYRPKEIEAKFDTAGEFVTERDYAYYEGMPPEEYYYGSSESERNLRITSSGDISTKIIYSLESFVKAMRNDL